MAGRSAGGACADACPAAALEVRGRRVTAQEAAGLLSILALALAFFAVAAGMLPAGRARRKPVKAENPMFPALENYREKLRKERA